MNRVKDQFRYNNCSADATQSIFQALLPALKRLDGLLKNAVDAARTMQGSKEQVDPFRGLYISDGDVENLLNREPADPSLNSVGKRVDDSRGGWVGNGSRLSLLKQAYKLSIFELDLILIALAPEIDLRYERLYAYLQDDITRKRPTVDLALNLLCTSPEEKLARRSHFAPNAPLARRNILYLITDPNQIQAPLLSRYLKLDAQIVRFVLCQEGLDSRLASFCEIIAPTVSFDSLPLAEEVKEALPAIVTMAWKERQALKLYFQGLAGTGKRRAAEAIASEIGTPLMVADLARISENDSLFDQTIKILLREVRFQNAVLFLDRTDPLLNTDRTNQFGRLMEALGKVGGIIIMEGTKSWVPPERVLTGVITVNFDFPDFIQRKSQWRTGLREAGIALNGNNLDVLAGHFRLTASQISEAICVAGNQARWRMATIRAGGDPLQISGQPTLKELLAAARAQSGHDLAALARKIEPTYTWNDIVLPNDTIKPLHEICQRVVHRHQVLGVWGFGRKLSLGKGVNALFDGPSGTGKTMAAEIVANELGLDLYKIDLSGVISKYIGETEKNLATIFRAAENANVILLFDEADALFGKRSEVRDSHDRYANIEISYLLQKMEEYEGLSILSTNLRQNMDDAFVRRMAFAVNFPFPGRTNRRLIWEVIWPAEVPLAEDIDLDFMACRFKLAGGNIKNIALAAAYLSAETGGAVEMTHLLQATRREYQKMGKVLSEDEMKYTGNDPKKAAPYGAGDAAVSHGNLIRSGLSHKN